MRLPCSPIPRAVFVVASMAVLAGGCVLFLWPRSSTVPMQRSAQIIPADIPMAAPPATFFERSVPMSWGWLWRLRDKIRGPQDTILVSGTVVDCTEIPDDDLQRILPESAALTETNGVR